MIDIDVADDAFSSEKQRDWYVQLAHWVLTQENCHDAQISLSLVDNATIHQLNRHYLSHDYPTDVITFPLGQEPLLGEIVIGREYAQGPAQDAGWSVGHEIGLYLVHGLLHLLDYDDQTQPERAQMHARQQQLLESYLVRVEPPPDDQAPSTWADSKCMSSVGRK